MYPFKSQFLLINSLIYLIVLFNLIFFFYLFLIFFTSRHLWKMVSTVCGPLSVCSSSIHFSIFQSSPQKQIEILREWPFYLEGGLWLFLSDRFFFCFSQRLFAFFTKYNILLFWGNWLLQNTCPEIFFHKTLYPLKVNVRSFRPNFGWVVFLQLCALYLEDKIKYELDAITACWHGQV